ncbi:MAG: tRNA (adenosine(37)-N6)-dimethylallyltransferase MiaA [Bacteroidota bacterium]
MAEASPIIQVFTGPTAAGKSATAIGRAMEIPGAEIISADSRQIYREIAIGTAKPGVDEQAGLPHHFVDELSLSESFSAGAFAAEANQRIATIISRGGVPIVVGGSPLYIQALVFGLAPLPPKSPAIRAELMHAIDTGRADVLFAELERVDPVSAATMDMTKSQRLVRALEIYRSTGRTRTSFFAEQRPPPFRYHTTVITHPRQVLYDRINRRVDQMLEAGLVDEVQRVLDSGFSADLNALQTIGYQEPIAYLRGDLTKDQMRERIKRNTRRFAKRQLTWFRKHFTFEEG